MTPDQPATPRPPSTVSAKAIEAGARAIVDRCPGDHDIGEARLEARAVLEAGAEELAEMQALFDLQWTRMGDATRLWVAEDPKTRAGILPDLGDLLTWLIKRGDDARAQRDEARRDAATARSLVDAIRHHDGDPAPVKLTRSGQYTIPGLDGVWRPNGLITTGQGVDGRAQIPFVRVDQPAEVRECPCFCFELDTDVDQDADDPDQLLCECSHTLGEHDAHGDCKAAAIDPEGADL